ncbi:MAG TPA: DUF4129 domain-containing protein [Ornithinibacter sp.]|nr:DUF4129 domain-containing protein [Ornithinibacter sp.]
MQSREQVVAALGRRPVVTAMGVLTILFVVWAAAVPRPERVISGWREGLEVRQIGADDERLGGEVDLEVTPSGQAGQAVDDVVGFVLGWTAVAVVVLFVVFCLVVAVRAWLRTREHRTPAAADAPDLDLEALAVAVTGDTSDRLAALSAGTPAEGVVAAWSHLEATLREAGVPLPPSRTSSEVSLDVLRRYAVDPETLTTLAALYREARWSHHPLTEADRTRAATAYRALDTHLRAAASLTPGAARAPRG